MAEARTEEEEEENMRENREQVVVRRQPTSSGDRPDRRKPEHRHSQGPLSSIRAAIKRTSTRSTSLSETPRDRDRDRRRPEITILSAEPLASTSWFPGASGGFPPPPPPAAQIWGPTIPPSIQPPPSYEEVIREKTQEQVLLPSSSSSSSSSQHPVSTTTIATQTDTGSAPDPRSSQLRRPVKPPRPSFPYTPKPSHVDDITVAASQSSLWCDCVGPNTHPETATHTHSATHTQPCDHLAESVSPLTSTSSAQTDQRDLSLAAVTVTTRSKPSPVAPLECPRPRPRSKPSLQPISRDVKVQTLVKLREDGLATLAARKGSDVANQEVSQGKYLQELLDAFSSDDWGFPDHRSDGSGLSQSEGEEGDEDQEEEVEEQEMAALKARIQAFEQQQQVADGSYGDGNDGDRGSVEEVVVDKRPEPRPRPRLQGQPAKPAPPTVAPKPKTLAPTPKPSSKGFWEDMGLTAVETDLGGVDTLKTETLSKLDLDPEAQPPTESTPSCTLNPAPGLVPQPCKPTANPSVIPPKPQSPIEPAPSSTSTPAPVPAPRPPLPKQTPCLTSSQGDTPVPANPKPPPRPPVAPRASVGAPPQDKSDAAGQAAPVLPPRPSVEVGGGVGANSSGAETQSCSAETQPASSHTVKPGSGRPVLPTKPTTLTSLRRASGKRDAPSLVCKPTGPTPASPDPPPVLPKPASKPPAPAPGLKPPVPAPAPALRKASLTQTKADTTSATNPTSSDPPLRPRSSGVKLLPLRPPPIKSIPGRPPPPTINTSSSAANQTAPQSKSSPAPSVTNQPPPSKTSPSPSPVTANQMPGQRATKRGPPLPPRPKPGHPLYNSYMKQEVLVVLDDPSPAPPEHPLDEGRSQTVITPLIDRPQCILDLDVQPEPVSDLDNQSKPDLGGLSQSESQSILPVQPTEQKEQPDPAPVSGPRCVARFDYEGEEDDELTFSQGDVIALLELIGQEWGRGQIHGRIGIFPINFAEVVEPLPQPPSSLGETTTETTAAETAALKPPQDQTSVAEEWAVALFDFPGQTAEDLSFHKGALIRVTAHIDTDWRRGRLEGREGLYPAAFTQPCDAQPIPGQQSAVKGVVKALFDFTATNEDELTLKVGDVIAEAESVDEEWIMGVVGGKRGIVPKNYISPL